jgi:tetratricopeptide (TPR) repeat protein
LSKEMAVHRKRPLLRDPNSGKRSRRRLLLLSALIMVGGLGFLSQAQAQEGSLSGGAATFAAGKYESSVRLMTGVLQGDNVPPADAAKALYYRGLAYQKLGQHTRAIADLGAAMWLGLSSSERTVALVNRSLAYQAAGLKAQAEAELASARKSGGGEVEKLLASNGGTGSDAGSISPFATEVRTESGRTSTVASASQDAPLPPAPAPRNSEAANPNSWTTTQGEAPAAPPPSGNRLSRWWGSVRGSSSESAPAPPPAPAPSAPRATAAAVPSAWTTQTQAEAGAAAGTRVAAASSTAPVPSGGGGKYLLQLSPTRSEAEASALWKTVVKQNQQLASLQPRVEKTDMGNLGTFYRLQIGPFPDKVESLKLCNALKRSGVDCFLVNP